MPEIKTIRKEVILNLICDMLLVPLNEYIIYKPEGETEGNVDLKRWLKTIVGTWRSATSDWFGRFSD